MPTLICTNCDISFEREQKQITSSKLHNVKNTFCSRTCSVSYQNKHLVKKNQRVSKLELWLRTRITETFPALVVLYNVKDALGDSGETDIWVPSLKLAFEVQGPSHYEPIYGMDRLLNEQKNDEEKRQTAKQMGIELIEIDARNFKTFKKNYELVSIVEKVLNTIKDRLSKLPNS